MCFEFENDTQVKIKFNKKRKDFLLSFIKFFFERYSSAKLDNAIVSRENEKQTRKKDYNQPQSEVS